MPEAGGDPEGWIPIREGDLGPVGTFVETAHPPKPPYNYLPFFREYYVHEGRGVGAFLKGESPASHYRVKPRGPAVWQKEDTFPK